MSTQFKDIPNFIHLTTQPDGLITAKTNTHVVENVCPSQLEYIYMPYAGEECTVQVTGQDTDMVEHVKAKLLENVKLFSLLNADHPILNNMFKNIRSCYSDRSKAINNLKGRFYDTDQVILVGAGPSLTPEVLEQLRTVIDEDKAIVIAGGSANRILDNAGIYPHFALAFDPHEAEYDAIGRLSHTYTEKTPFLCTLGLEKRVFNLPWKDKFIIPSGTFPAFAKHSMPDIDMIDEGCSGVMTLSINLLKYLGASNVTFIGTDLSFGKGNVMYADSEGPMAIDGHIEYKGLSTKEIWVKEAHYIINRGKELGIEVTTATPSLLNKLGVRKVDLIGLHSYCYGSYIRGIVQTAKPIEGTARYMLAGLYMDACMIEALGELDEYGRETDLYKTILKSWDMMQQFKEVRGHIYNNYMIMAIVKQIMDNTMD